MGADDIETFTANPAQVGRFLLSGKFVCQFLRDGGVLRHADLRSRVVKARFARRATGLGRGGHASLCPPYSRPRATHAFTGDADAAGSAMDFSARMRTKTLSPTGVLSDGCARASKQRSPILTRKSRCSPRNALPSTTPTQTVSKSAP